jgi:aquaporin Z
MDVGAWAAEFAGTAFQLFSGFTVVALVSDHASAVGVRSDDLRLAIVGLTFGLLAAVVAVSPLGLRSGAHLNPAVTLAFWLRGRLAHRDLAGYAASQVLAALLATSLFVMLSGPRAAGIHDAVTMPGPAIGAAAAVAIEAGLTAALLVVLFAFLASPRMARWTPLAAAVVLALLIWGGARLTGASLNPARSLAPAIVAGDFSSLWIYLVGPPLGALVAAAAFRPTRAGGTARQAP